MFSVRAKKLHDMNNIFFFDQYINKKIIKVQHNNFLGNFQKNRFHTLIFFCAILFAKWWNNVCRHPKINLGLIVKIQCGIIKIISHTVHNLILCMARNFLETRENIKIFTHPFYRINLDLFSWTGFFVFFWKKKKIQNGRLKKECVFRNRQFSKFFRETFTYWSLG